ASVPCTVRRQFPCTLGRQRPAPCRLQQSSVEGQRQQIFQLVNAFVIAEVGEMNLEVAGELPQNLPAGAARWRGGVGVGDDRDSGELPMALRERLEHRD